MKNCTLHVRPHPFSFLCRLTPLPVLSLPRIYPSFPFTFYVLRSEIPFLLPTPGPTFFSPTTLTQSSLPPSSSSLMFLHISPPAQSLFVTFATSGSPPPPPPLLCAAGGALPLVLTCRGTDSVKVLTPHSRLCQGLVLHTHTSVCRVHA